uniref:Cytochrome P450 CYP6CX1v1 n=1 Tax=Bemisia tabaci TaxID=7038 RepID=D8V034_BEMTA|nr:cytochrome P450 CYP6CX1v1 [Bemisia tabaci]
MELLTSILSLPVNSVLVFTGAALFLWYYLQDQLSYWRKRGVPYISPIKCFSFTMAQTLRTKSVLETTKEMYELLEGHSYGGIYRLFRPAVILRDPGMVKEWLVKGFPSFHDRNSPPDKKARNLSGNLFTLTGDRWHTVRTKLAPAFSSAKLKVMYQTLKGCASDVNAHLQGLCSAKGEVEIDIKDLVSRYAMDVIGACALGIQCNAIKDPENCQMRKAVQQIFRINWRFSLQILLSAIHPKLALLFSLSRGTSEVTKFLTSVTKEAMDVKKKAGSSRKDFLQIMMSAGDTEIEKRKLKSAEDEDFVFTENVITSMIGLFLSAGLDPVATTVTFCLYELAYHPEIQDRLFQEIQPVRNECGDEIGFEDLKKLQYLEQVVNETLRKYPPAGVLSRKCTESFQIPDSSVVIEKGLGLMIPAACFHHDPKYFPDPEKFNPERFSKENIGNIVPGSYIPFGEGPRFCIANRLALMDVKTMLITLVSDYALHPCARTKNHFEFDRETFTLNPKGEVWLRLKKRN